MSRITPEQKRKIVQAVGSRCELCSIRFLPRLLCIHRIDAQGAPPENEWDPDQLILVLCPVCHRLLRALSPDRTRRSMQERLIRNRPPSVRTQIRSILGCRSRPYTPPPVDLAEIFEEFQQRGGFRAF